MFEQSFLIRAYRSLAVSEGRTQCDFVLRDDNYGCSVGVSSGELVKGLALSTIFYLLGLRGH